MKFAILPAAGIGDALLMQIAAHHLQSMGVETVTFSKHLAPLASWFPGSEFSSSKQELGSVDGIILQHDNSPFAHAVRSGPVSVYTLFASHSLDKHGPLRSGFDQVFDRTKCMAENIALSMHALFPQVPFSLSNGLQAPKGLERGAHPRRIAIHPTSTDPAKNWLKHRFLKLRDRLKQEGWDPVFITAPHEAAEWGSPLFPTLADLAAFLYESKAFIGNDSGPGHLASNLGLPTLTMGPNKPHLTLWRPGWSLSRICYPPSWTAKTKLTRNKWNYFLSISHILKEFKKLTEIKSVFS
jgi:ADP-heptose:LPS heptosyltransferase